MQHTQLGDRIIATATPGVATGKAFYGKPAALASTMFLNCFAGIMRAAGVKAAVDAEQGREEILVEGDEAKERPSNNLPHLVSLTA